MELDGCGSQRRLTARIHELLPDLKPNFNVIELARALDIVSIEERPVSGFTAMLVTDELKRDGDIILAEGQPYKRRRFSICHELGHFLIDSHKPGPDGRCQCSDRDMRAGKRSKMTRAERMEVEANAFAARLLMPLHKIEPELSEAPNLDTVAMLAERFEVSKDAMARTYAEHHTDPIAILVTRHGKLLRTYRDRDRFPHLPARNGNPLPQSSAYFGREHVNGAISEADEVDPDAWLSDPERDHVLALREQVFWQRDGFALVLLEAEMDEDY